MCSKIIMVSLSVFLLVSAAAGADEFSAYRNYVYDPNDFAAEVVNYIQGSGVGYDWISLDYYSNPQTALGRVTLETTGDMNIGENVSMPVVPVYPAWRAFEVVTIGNGGELILKFNHPVSDDENNLYGIDFIIFGNSWWRVASGGSWGPDSNPETITAGSPFRKEPGIVSVSQDGQTWYKFTTGPYADDFAPTASYEWDDVNDVWGGKLNPTRPVDPNFSAGGFYGSTVAQIIVAYNGSAGGTGYDLKNLAPQDYAVLATDPNTGRKWVQYIKIEDDPTNTTLTSEIDAISDVSCCGDYKHPYPVGDLNEDCRVDFVDFAILAQDWLAGSDWDDLATLAGNWLYCNWECE